MIRIKGLDSIRFICALFVMIGHFGFPLPASIAGPASHGSLKMLGTLINLIFNGPAAVIIFFVISGFCIHYPFKDKRKIDLLPYYTRRLTRIGIPAFIALLCYIKLHIELKPPLFSIFWSIMCEIIYYLIYPAIFYINKSINWKYIVLASYILSLFILFMHLDTLQAEYHAYPALGYATWLVGWPCWFLGCWLSEEYMRFKVLSVTKMWLMRFGIIGLVLILDIIRFQVKSVFASNCFILNAFAIIVFIWLGFEIMYNQVNTPWKLFEWSGKWSYSLYIMHPPIAATCALFISLNSTSPVFLLMQILMYLLYLIMAYLFYVIVESPSHRFSGFISKKLTRVA